jgi:hypothetical protein
MYLNSVRNKSMERHIPFLLQTTSKNGFFGLQTSGVPVRYKEKKRFFVNFERYDLANGKGTSVQDLVDM